jgi:hypothetical protein
MALIKSISNAIEENKFRERKEKKNQAEEIIRKVQKKRRVYKRPSIRTLQCVFHREIM